MKQVLTLFLLLAPFGSTAPGDCKCSRPARGETTHFGGNESVVVDEQEVYRHAQGVVIDTAGPVEGALVEVFTHPEKWLDSSGGSRVNPKQRRIAACRTRADGRFCFRGLAAGKYEIRSSLNTGWNVTHFCVGIDPENGKTGEIEVTMHVGT